MAGMDQSPKDQTIEIRSCARLLPQRVSCFSSWPWLSPSAP